MVTSEEVREKLEQYLDYNIDIVEHGNCYLCIVDSNGGMCKDYYVFDEQGDFTHHESLKEAMHELWLCEKQVCNS